MLPRTLLHTQVPVDSWLQLLQAACHAVRAVVRLHGYDSLKAIYRCGVLDVVAAAGVSLVHDATPTHTSCGCDMHLKQLLTEGYPIT